MSEPTLWVVDGILDSIATPHGRIIMAGADIATVYPGWITGAINSGHVAAQEAEQRLGVAGISPSCSPTPVGQLMHVEGLFSPDVAGRGRADLRAFS